MEIDIFNLNETPGHESRLISMYNVIEVVFDLEDSLACDNFAAY